MVLVALVTSVMAPPVLRHAMSRITQTDEELVRKIDHDTWDGVERVQRAVVLCSRPVGRPTLSLDPPKPFRVYRCFSRSGP